MVTCRKSGCENKAAKGQAYCSKACAPLSRLKGGPGQKASLSARTAGSGTTEPGVQFQEPSESAGRRSRLSVKNTLPTKPSENTSSSGELAGAPTRKTLLEIGRMVANDTPTKPPPLSSSGPPTENEKNRSEGTLAEMKSNEPGITDLTKTDSPKSAPTATVESPSEMSAGQLLSLEEEKLASLSLVDDVTARLHLQIKRLTLRPETVVYDPIEASHSERQRAGLALKTASEIGKMIRLKLDAVKVFRDLGGGR